MSGNTRRNTGRFSSVARSSNGPALNEAFSCNILRELDQSIKFSYNKAWTDLDGLKKNGAELLKQLKYEDRDIPVFAEKLLKYANSSNREFNTQNAAMLDCIHTYYSGSKFIKDIADDVMSNSYIKSSGAVKALELLAVGLGGITNIEWSYTKSSTETVPKNNYMSFDRKRSTRYIMDRIASAGFAPDTVKDSDFYIMKKVPKTMSVASKASNDVLFWTFSKDPDFLGFKETDRLVAVTKGNEVIWSHQLANTPKYYRNVKDVFNMMTGEFGPYRSEHGYSVKVIALRFSDSTAKSGSEMWGKRLGRGDARKDMIRQENEYVRTMDYIKILNDNITRYKRILASNRLKSDTVDSDVKNIISKVSAAMPKLFEQNVSWVRSVSNTLSAMMTNFENYTRYRNELNNNGANNPWMSRSWIEVTVPENIKTSKDKISKCIDEINSYLNKLS